MKRVEKVEYFFSQSEDSEVSLRQEHMGWKRGVSKGSVQNASAFWSLLLTTPEQKDFSFQSASPSLSPVLS